MNNVHPIRARLCAPRHSWIPDEISPEHVLTLFERACSGRTRAKVPGIEACRGLSFVLSAMRTRGQIVPIGLDEHAERKLRTALGALEPVLAAAAPYEGAIRSEAFQASLAALRRLQHDASYLLANFRRPEPTSWHADARSIAGFASVAWGTVMARPPVATKAESPMTLFVAGALALTGRHYALDTVDQALRRQNG